jgi:hypothetical protein
MDFHTKKWAAFKLIYECKNQFLKLFIYRINIQKFNLFFLLICDGCWLHHYLKYERNQNHGFNIRTLCDYLVDQKIDYLIIN